MKPRLPYVAAFLLLLNVAFFFFAIIPAQRAERAHAATLQVLHARMRVLRLEHRSQQVMQALLKKMEQFRNQIPPQGAILAMVRRATDEARRLKLHVPSVRYEPGDVAEDELVKLTVQMEVEGRYAAIRRFLYEVEGLQDPLMIERLVLSSQRGANQLTLRLQLAAFFLGGVDRTKVKGTGTEQPSEETQAGVEG
ncbi:MAG: type 4a pilus biogenesis protein PilO [Candidatus Methylomirabilales bacterium]